MLVDLISLFLADAERLSIRFLESETKGAVIFDIFPDLGVITVDCFAILFRDRALATWNAVLGISLEAHKLRHILRDRGDDLHSSRAIANHSYTLPPEIDTLSPVSCMMNLTVEGVNAFKLRVILSRE